MTSGRNLGPILAIGGGVIVVGAVIAGFLAIGGPGDARARRLDAMTMQWLQSLAHDAQCAFNLTGKTYASVEELHDVAEDAARVVISPDCGYVERLPDEVGVVGSDGNPERPGEIDYTRIDDTHIRLCGNFRRPYDPKAGEVYAVPAPGGAVSEFDEARPAGPHCYDVELIKRPPTAAPAAAETKPPPAAAMPPEPQPAPK